MIIATWNVERLKHRRELDTIIEVCDNVKADILVLRCWCLFRSPFTRQRLWQFSRTTISQLKTECPFSLATPAFSSIQHMIRTLLCVLNWKPREVFY